MSAEAYLEVIVGVLERQSNRFQEDGGGRYTMHGVFDILALATEMENRTRAHDLGRFGRMRVFRHRVRRTYYNVVGVASMQYSTDIVHNMLDGQPFVVYRCLDSGRYWVRPETEFLDGRFEEIE